MKKLLWLLLLPAVLAGWIMSPNPGLDLWGGANGDTLLYGSYKSSSYFHKTSGMVGEAGLLTHPVGVSYAMSCFLHAFIEPTPTGYVDTLVIWMKGEENNEFDSLILRIDSAKWIKRILSAHLKIETDWTRYAIPVTFSRSGHYRIWAHIETTTSSHEDSIYIDSLYIKRIPHDKHLKYKQRKEKFYTAADAYYIYDYWTHGYPESTHKLNLTGMRIQDSFSPFLDTMDVTTDLFQADWALWDSTFELLYSAGMNRIMVLFWMSDSKWGPKGMRYDTVGNLTVGIPLREDGAMYLSRACQHTDSLLSDWGWKSSVKYVGILGEQLTWSSYWVTSEAIDTVLSRCEEWYDTVKKYFPDVKVGMSSLLYRTFEDSAQASGYSFPQVFDTYMPHVYAYGIFEGADSLYDVSRSLVSRVDGADRLSCSDFDFCIFAEWLTLTPNYTENNPVHWLTIPGLIGKSHTEWISWDTWVTPSWMIRFQYEDTLTALWWGQYFLQKYQGHKTYLSDLSYSPLLFVKIEPDIYLISNPTYDTLEVILPKTGIAKVRWLDPNTEFPILRTENRSPIYEKTMCVGNRLTIPPGYMYAIEYLR